MEYFMAGWRHANDAAQQIRADVLFEQVQIFIEVKDLETKGRSVPINLSPDMAAALGRWLVYAAKEMMVEDA